MDQYTKPDYNRCAILTIDTQNDFSLPGAIAEIGGTMEVIPLMERILEAGRDRRIPIVHVIRLYEEDGSNADLCRREKLESGASIVRPGTEGAELVGRIKPGQAIAIDAQALLRGEFQAIGDSEWVMYKPRWGAFYQTNLERFLKDENVDTLIFIGCNFPNCPRTSIYQASERDFKIVMVEDAISGVYGKGIDEMKNIGVYVANTNQLLAEWEGIQTAE